MDFIVVTGTRRPSRELDSALWRLKGELDAEYPPQWQGLLVCGEAQGADERAGDTFMACQVWVISAPWGLLPGPKAGPVRNAAIAGAAKEMLVRGLKGKGFAFPDAESRGTWDCVRRLREVGLEVEVRPIGEKP